MDDQQSKPLPPSDESIEGVAGIPIEEQLESGEPGPVGASEPAFVCACNERSRPACSGLAFYKEQEGRRYCVLHYPGREKSADFKPVLDAKLASKDFDFREVWFPDPVDFGDLEFSAKACFISATFSAQADFRSATFSAEADFRSATFSAAADFSSATLK